MTLLYFDFSYREYKYRAKDIWNVYRELKLADSIDSNSLLT